MRQGGAISVEVLNEVANIARRRMRLTWAQTRTLLHLIRGLLTVHALEVAAHEVGLRLAERYALALYDAMIVVSALGADCDTLRSEDMQHGMLIDGRLRILDPFRSA